MNRISLFALQDIEALDLSEAQCRDHPRLEDRLSAASVLASGGRAFTLRSPAGTVLLCAGVVEVDRGYGHAWAFMSREAGPHMRWLTGRVRWYLNGLMADHRRIELIARADFPPAARWARLLGFEQEGVLHCAARDGSDMLRFARFQRAPEIVSLAA